MIKLWLNKYLRKSRGLFRNKLVVLVLLLAVVCVALVLCWWLTRRVQPKTPATAPAPAASVKAAARLTPPSYLSSGWTYLPGTTVQNDTLLVSERTFAIVNQDGSGGQANPPVNLYGKHLKVSGGFVVNAQLQNPALTKATLRLYGDVPTIMDEFRIEPKSVRVTLNGATLTVERWDGNTIQPAYSRTFPVKPATQNQLRITRQNGQIAVNVGGIAVGTIPEQGVFAAGNVWFGAESQGGSWTLSNLTVGPLAGGTVQTIDTSALPTATKKVGGLQDLASKRRPGFLIGAAAALAPLAADDSYRQTLVDNFNLVTTENALKWQFVHPAPNTYDFHEGDALVDFAARNGIKVHGHTLVFGEANPQWVQKLPASEREAVMLDHIKTVVGHYKGKIASWDVVNEPFDDETWDQLRPHLWEQAMGDQYIPKAFQAAHQADPTALLFMNDYGLEEDGDRWDAMLGLVTKLKKQGVPIDGVGFESHVYTAADKINGSVLRKHFQQLAAVGLKARLSEMDVYSEDGQAVQASQYSQVLAACLNETNCISFGSWGVSDRYDWFKDDDGSVQQGQDLLWDNNMQPTPAVGAMLQVLR